MSFLRNSRMILTVAALATVTITPAFALPNTGAFNRSAEGFKLKMQQICTDVGQVADDIEQKGMDSPVAPPPGGRQSDKYNRSEAQDLREKGKGVGCNL
jgi:hypothetical protein